MSLVSNIEWASSILGLLGIRGRTPFLVGAAIALSFGLLMGPSVVAGQDGSSDATARADKARQLGEEGLAAYRKGDYARATVQLAEAYETLPVPMLGLWSARAYAKAGQLVEAAARYRDVEQSDSHIGDRAKQREAQRAAAREAKQLSRGIPVLTVVVTGDDANTTHVVKLDERPLPSALTEPQTIQVNPGKHSVVLEDAQGHILARQETAVAERQTAEVQLFLPPSRTDTQNPGVVEGNTKVVGVPAAAETATTLATATDSASTPVVTPEAIATTSSPRVSDRPESSSSSTWRTIGWVSGATGLVLAGVGLSYYVPKIGSSSDRQRVAARAGDQAASDSAWGKAKDAQIGAWITGLGGAGLVALGAVLVLTNLGPTQRVAPHSTNTGASLLPSVSGKDLTLTFVQNF